MAKPRILYDNRLNDGTPAASTTATDYHVDNLLDWRTYTEWKPTALPATVTVDAGSALSADYALIWGHDLATQGATVQIRGSTDNFGASDVLVASETPTTDDPIVLYFSSTSYRYWRIRITGSTMPTLAIAAIGDYLEMPAGLGNGFDPIGRIPKGRFNRAAGGAGLGRVLDYEEWKQALTFPRVSWAWIRSDFEPAWTAHLRKMPFAFDWNPGAATYGDETRLVEMEAGFDGPHHAGSIADLSFTVTGAI